MKFSIPLIQLNKHIQQLASICPSDASRSGDVSQCVLFDVTRDTLTLKATDYSLEVSCRLPVSDVTSPGAIAINAAKLVGLCSKLDADAPVTFELDEGNNTLSVSSGTSRSKLRARNADDFPSFPFFDEAEQHVPVSQRVLRQLIESSIFCIATDDFRDYLRGLRLEIFESTLTAFASDSHRLAIIETELDAKTDSPVMITVTQKFAYELTKILSQSDDRVDLLVSSNKIGINCNQYTVLSNLIVCDYPQVRSIIPKKYGYNVGLPVKQLKSLVSRVSVLSSRRVNGVTFHFESNLLNLHARNSEHEEGSDQLNISYDAKPFDITLNAAYVNRILDAMPTTDFIMRCPADISSAMFEPDYQNKDKTPDIRQRYMVSRIII